MNRMSSQSKRGGAFYCIDNQDLHKILNSLITSRDVCQDNKNLIINEWDIYIIKKYVYFGWYFWSWFLPWILEIDDRITLIIILPYY